MDIEKLIHCLQCCVRVDAHNVGCDDCGLEYCGPECQQLCGTAAIALSTLQAENKRLNKIVCAIPTTPDSGRTISQYDKEMSMCAYLDDLEAENERLRAELERVKLVRCKDCKMSRPGGLGYVWCGPTAMPLDGFCSNGQQKED